MRQSIGTCCVVAVALLGLVGCRDDNKSMASGTSSDSTASTSNSTQAGTTSTTSSSTNALQSTLIYGNPPLTVGVGQAYMFRPTVSGTGNTGVTFAIKGKPSWASFDSGTGTLSGTPASSDVGVNTGVQISGSSGPVTMALPAFEITVTTTAASSSSSSPSSTPPATTSPATASITLTWQQPNSDTNGNPLTNLSGYKVYFGTTSQTYTNSIAVSNPDALSYIVPSLTVGQTYYFAVTAVNSSGVESAYSPEVSTTI